MANLTFKALQAREITGGGFETAIVDRTTDSLPEGEVLVKVRYSSLNYKDALSAAGNKGVTREYPHTPGIDAAGEVVEDTSGAFAPGAEVIVTSYDLGMNTSGGFGQYIRVPAAWVAPLPEGLSLKEAMMLGTAGLTAGMCVQRLAEAVVPGAGPIVVSGATGGVGSISVAILSKLGYQVAAVTGKPEAAPFLESLGASEIIARDEIGEPEKRPLLKSRFAGAVDTVGGPILENIIKSAQPMAVVASCGNAASPQLNLTVFPFILRGVSLVGIDSQNFPMPARRAVWQHLATDWKPGQLMSMAEVVGLEGLQEKIGLILKGQLKGRVVVDLWG